MRHLHLKLIICRKQNSNKSNQLLLFFFDNIHFVTILNSIIFISILLRDTLYTLAISLLLQTLLQTTTIFL